MVTTFSNETVETSDSFTDHFDCPADNDKQMKQQVLVTSLYAKTQLEKKAYFVD